MSEFVASNGITVTTLDDGQVGFSRPVPGTQFEQRAQWLRPDEAQALRESFDEGEKRCGESCRHGGSCSLDRGHFTEHESRSPSGEVFCRWDGTERESSVPND
jgi:hypothetical protein